MAKREPHEPCAYPRCTHRASHWVLGVDLYVCPLHLEKHHLGAKKVILSRDAIYTFHARRIRDRMREAPASRRPPRELF
jgi:hypothetical protein